MKNLHKLCLALALCCLHSIAAAYNPALDDESRWVFYDADKEGVMKYDSASVTLEGDRYAYVWVRKVYNKEELLGKSDLQLIYIDCEKKKHKILDYLMYNNKQLIGSSARYNVLTGAAATPWDDKYVEKKTDKDLVKQLFDKKHKTLLISEDTTKSNISQDNAAKWDYLMNLSTNVWQYVGGRNLLYGNKGAGESYVFYYDKQSLELSPDGKQVTAWIKYRYLDGKQLQQSVVPVQYGLSKTTINLENKTYVDSVMLAFDKDGTLIEEYTTDTGTERPILTGTIMAMLYDALSKAI